VLNLNGSDWCVTLVCECLYQYWFVLICNIVSCYINEIGRQPILWVGAIWALITHFSLYVSLVGYTKTILLLYDWPLCKQYNHPCFKGIHTATATLFQHKGIPVGP
jgi:hypothetical protein